MRASLIIFGVIFLVIGALLYLVPIQGINANTSNNGNVNTSSANVTVPTGWAIASATVGFVLLIFGLVIPDANRRGDSKKDSYDSVVESKENIEIGEGSNKRKIVKERTERYKSKDDDSN